VPEITGVGGHVAERRWRVAPNRSSLPARRMRLIGRDGELAGLVARLRDREARLVTLLGAGGAGKTSLALEVARELERTFTDGAWVLDLASVPTADALELACCDALLLVDRQDAPREVLTGYLAPRCGLLVLDNCEPLADAVAELVDHLLDTCPDLTILATSRVRLRVNGEHVHVVAPLRVGDARDATNLDELARVPAVELFVARATEADPSFSLADEAATVASICRAVDGLPLAIELAAAQVPALTPTKIAARLSRLVGVEGRSRHRRSRQRTMDATLNSSYDLLDDRERTLFRRLAVFSGGWTLPAAEHVGFPGY
jgi:predicted ATPase